MFSNYTGGFTGTFVSLVNITHPPYLIALSIGFPVLTFVQHGGLSGPTALNAKINGTGQVRLLASSSQSSLIFTV